MDSCLLWVTSQHALESGSTLVSHQKDDSARISDSSEGLGKRKDREFPKRMSNLKRKPRGSPSSCSHSSLPLAFLAGLSSGRRRRSPQTSLFLNKERSRFPVSVKGADPSRLGGGQVSSSNFCYFWTMRFPPLQLLWPSRSVSASETRGTGKKGRLLQSRSYGWACGVINDRLQCAVFMNYWVFLSSPKDFFFIASREMGRERGRDINVIEKHWLVASQMHLDQGSNCNPSTCPDWESNLQHFCYRTTLQPTETHQPGHELFSFKKWFV